MIDPGKMPPLAVIATWPTPNYIDPVTRGPEVVVVSVILGGLAVAVVAARIYARVHILKSFGIDDGLILLATVSNLA